MLAPTRSASPRLPSFRLAGTQNAPPRRRGGIVAAAMAAIAIASAGTVAVISFSSSSTASKSASPGPRPAQPREVAVIFHLLGITPQGLAAAGVTGQGCDELFATGMVYCLQAERLTQLQLAHRDVNLASEKAVRPDSPGAINSQGQQITLSECKTALSNLESTGFTFVTTGMDAGITSKLATIKANQHWGLPTPYLVVNRTDEEWLELRGALNARRFATEHNLELAPRLVQILAAAEGDPTVARSLSDYGSGLLPVSAAWRAQELHDGP